MKFKLQHLFYTLAIISLALMLFTLNKMLDITVHDTYFVLSYFYYFLEIFALPSSKTYSQNK